MSLPHEVQSVDVEFSSDWSGLDRNAQQPSDCDLVKEVCLVIHGVAVL